MTAERRLEILFKRTIHRGHVRNAVLNPAHSERVNDLLRPEERCVVLVESKGQRSLWFTDRRLLSQDASGVVELFSYDAVRRVHWMARENRFALPKLDFFDRIEIDLDAGGLAIDGLDQAYLPVLKFLQWVAENQLIGE